MGRAEARVEDYLTERVEALGGLCWKFGAALRGGVPDRLVSLPWVGLLLVETKAPDGRLSKLQIAQHERLRAAGSEVHVASTRLQVDQLLDILVERMHRIASDNPERGGP